MAWNGSWFKHNLLKLSFLFYDLQSIWFDQICLENIHSGIYVGSETDLFSLHMLCLSMHLLNSASIFAFGQKTESQLISLTYTAAQPGTITKAMFDHLKTSTMSREWRK